MKIAITGGSGFIGDRLAQALHAAGHEILILDAKPSPSFPESYLEVDVCDKEALSRALTGVEAVYHLAAEHRDDVRPISRYYDVNVGGAEHLVAACEANKIKTLIFTSSVAVYGLNAGESREADAPAPFNDYGQSKLDSEAVFEKWVLSDPENRNLTMIRLVATFGPGNRGNVYTLMSQMARGRFLMVGTGKNRKSIAYVENVAAFLAYCLTTAQPGTAILNYADKPDLSTKDLVGFIRDALGIKGKPLYTLPYWLGIAGGAVFDVLSRITGKRFPISVVRVRKFCADTVVNADKAHVTTGFKAPHSLETGIRTMIAAEFGPHA